MAERDYKAIAERFREAFTVRRERSRVVLARPSAEPAGHRHDLGRPHEQQSGTRIAVHRGAAALDQPKPHAVTRPAALAGPSSAWALATSVDSLMFTVLTPNTRKKGALGTGPSGSPRSPRRGSLAL